MKALKIVMSSILALLLILVLLAPIGPIPGFFIGGTPAKAPEQWDDTSKLHEIMLKVPGTPPRVVNIWVVEYEGDLYVAGNNDSGWVKMIGGGSPVEIRLGDTTYALNASVVAEGQKEILEAYAEKYRADYPDVIAGMVDEAPERRTLFLLDRR